MFFHKNLKKYCFSRKLRATNLLYLLLR